MKLNDMSGKKQLVLRGDLVLQCVGTGFSVDLEVRKARASVSPSRLVSRKSKLASLSKYLEYAGKLVLQVDKNFILKFLLN